MTKPNVHTMELRSLRDIEEIIKSSRRSLCRRASKYWQHWQENARKKNLHFRLGHHLKTISKPIQAACYRHWHTSGTPTHPAPQLPCFYHRAELHRFQYHAASCLPARILICISTASCSQSHTHSRRILRLELVDVT